MIEIESALQNLDRAAMARLLERIYGIHHDIDEIIESHIESAGFAPGESNNVAASMMRRIEQIASEHEFVGYRQSYAFAGRLRSLLEDIDTLLREQEAIAALESTERFLQLIEPVMNRVDDSGGDLGEVFRQAVDQWLDTAAQVRAVSPGHLNWVEKVLYFFDHNDYGCLDNIISHSRKLLSEEELRQLAWRFENEARKALASQANDRDYNSAAAHACLGLRSVAEALDDMGLYEKSTLIASPEPNHRQLESIIQFALEINDLERADYWLQQPQWQGDPARQSRLRAELLRQQGCIEQLKAHLLQAFLDRPSESTLGHYWGFASEQERAGIKQQAETMARECDDPANAIGMLLTLGNTLLAAETAIDRADSLPARLYSTMQEWAEQFEAAGQTLAAAVCYRALLTDLLGRGYSKAYHHGARYFHKLIELDRHIDDYGGLADGEAFIRQLQKQHWRKRAFWAGAGYPNKSP
ncbi:MULTISPECIES: DUF6880 family protein [unclassified Microbulbifer]|uniref:DUF6880 family protein n=1 Tax=unclassified Microbulbifer TaxID=2619833 RepID=UPI0027E4A0B4|nr:MULTISPECIES: DUF6880 family protein [unclassified Microbulbifer]